LGTLACDVAFESRDQIRNGPVVIKAGWWRSAGLRYQYHMIGQSCKRAAGRCLIDGDLQMFTPSRGHGSQM
jgi:hypothetical protein